MMSDPVSVDASTIHELLQTVKTLQSNMVELKSGGNGANNLPIPRPTQLVLPLQRSSAAKYVARG